MRIKNIGMAKSTMGGKMNKEISMMRPFVGGEELEAVTRVFESKIENELSNIHFLNMKAEYSQNIMGGGVVL